MKYFLALAVVCSRVGARSTRWIRLAALWVGGHVASAEGFTQQPAVVNGAEQMRATGAWS